VERDDIDDPVQLPEQTTEIGPDLGLSSITRNHIDLPGYGWSIDLFAAFPRFAGFDTSIRPELPVTAIGPADASHGESDVLRLAQR
jgi:hypothetical protein